MPALLRAHRSFLISVVVVVLTLVGALVVAVHPAGAAAPRLAVPFTPLSPTEANLTGSPAGSNDWTCRPSAAHPEPVVLVHGLLATAGDNWSTISPLLKNNGYCVYALTYGTLPGESIVGGLEPMEDSARQLQAFVAKVLAATGARKVDLVGHSEGTVMPQYYLKFLGGAPYVDKYVALTPIYAGTTLYGVSTVVNTGMALLPGATTALEKAVATGCGSCAEFLKGSAFNTALNRDGVAARGVTYTTIMTKYDELVRPYTSGYLAGATNFVLQDQCPLDFSEHLAVAFDPTAAQDILNALDPAHPKPVPCTLVLPAVGAPQAGTPAS
jgi:triacylglycerol lipase